MSHDLVSVLHKISRCLDSGLQTDVINLDISKVFDMVDHHIVTRKLKLLGGTGSY